jgi:hypothetical protein
MHRCGVNLGTMRRRMKQFFRNRGQLATFLGALIVFATFIVKEGLREHWQQTADSIDTAQYVFGIREDVRRLELKVGQINNDTRPVITLTSRSGSQRQDTDKTTSELRPLSPYETLWIELAATNDSLAKLKITMANIQVLASRLPPNDQTRQQSTRLEHDIDSLTDQVDKVRGAAIAKVPYMKAVTDEQKTTIVADAGWSWAYKDHQLEADMRSLLSGVLQDAERTRLRNSTYATFAWWISAFLFAFGWSLGLLAKVYGTDKRGRTEVSDTNIEV